MNHAAQRSLLALGLLASAVAGCADEADDSLSKELAVFESKLSSGATPQEACQELDVLCNTTGFGCKAHDLFCKVPTKEYICQQLASACASYPAACDVYNDHCGSGPITRDAGPVPQDSGPITRDACTLPPESCCAPPDLVCVGDPDHGVVCKCRWFWTDGGGLPDAQPYYGDARPYYPDARWTDW